MAAGGDVTGVTGYSGGGVTNGARGGRGGGGGGYADSYCPADESVEIVPVV